MPTPAGGMVGAPSGVTIITRGRVKTGKTSWTAEAAIGTKWRGEFDVALPGGIVAPGGVRWTVWRAELKGVSSDT